MIARSAPKIDPPKWQQELQEAYTDAATLLRQLALDPRDLHLADSSNHFPLRVPKAFVQRMRHRDRHDPLLRQVLPLAAEHKHALGFHRDPVGDGAAQSAPGLLKKYHGRALLMVSGACGVNCRYCFRRHYAYAGATLAERAGVALETLRQDTSISEVILSGGDPLMANDVQLRRLVETLSEMTHLRRLRIHSRLPVVIPSRITAELLDLLTSTRLQPLIVLHINHPNEIDSQLARACERLDDARIPLLNQSVLLRGVNDQSATLISLCERLFDLKILPYYMHLLDRVQGAAHFEVSDDVARELKQALRSALPGYLVPRFVRELAAAPHKIEI